MFLDNRVQAGGRGPNTSSDLRCPQHIWPNAQTTETPELRRVQPTPVSRLGGIVPKTSRGGRHRSVFFVHTETKGRQQQKRRGSLPSNSCDGLHPAPRAPPSFLFLFICPGRVSHDVCKCLLPDNEFTAHDDSDSTKQTGPENRT